MIVLRYCLGNVWDFFIAVQRCQLIKMKCFSQRKWSVDHMQIIEDSLDQLLKQVAIRTNAVANREAVEKSVREIIANVIKDGDKQLRPMKRSLTTLTSIT